MNTRQRVPVPKMHRPGKLLIPLLGVCVFLVTAAAARAQSDYLYEFGHYHWSVPVPVKDGYVDASNGNVHLSIPIASIPERGKVPYTASLVYDSHIWQESCSGGSCSWQPTNVAGSWGGWRLVTSDGTGGGVTYTTTLRKCYDGSRGTYLYYGWYTNFIWHSPDGHTIPFGGTTYVIPSACGGGGTSTFSGADQDQWGYHINVTNEIQATVYAPDGTEVYPTVEDTNGNYVNTLSTSAPLTTSTSGSTVTYTVTENSAGNPYNIVVTTESIPVCTNFLASGVGEDCNSSSTATVIESIALPDGSSYSFSYDSGTTSGHYGELTGMTLPTGGSVSFGYTNFQDAFGSVNQFPDSYTAAGATWSFTPQVVSTTCSTQCTQTVTIAKPNDSGGSDDEVHTFTFNNSDNSIALDTEQQYYTGPSTGTPLKTVDVTYTGDLPSIVKTILPTPSGSVTAMTAYTYGSNGFGNVTEEDDYNYAGSVFRKVLYTYLANSDNNMVDKKATITVENGSGTMIAQTNIYYDSYGYGDPATVTGAIGHDDTNFGQSYTARGNPTTVTQWVSGSTYDGASLTYDTTGQVLRVADSSGTTTFNYADNYFKDNGSGPPTTACNPSSPTNAFPTTVTLPNSDTIKRGFYCNTSELAESTGQNGNSTYYHYDSWDRPTETDYPDGGSITESYLLSNSLEQGTETQKAITSGVNLETKALIDTWGRVDENLLVNDPEGQTEVDTTYDGQNRVTKKTTPYRGTAGGSTVTTYDGLGRPLTITKPDGTSVTSIAYGSSGGATESCSNGPGYPELLTDAAGNQRVEWFGAFGHVIEVDEPDNSGTLNVKTCYSYDQLGDLTSVTTSTPQTRSYAYDGMGRLTSETTPEEGTVSYTYDNHSNVLTRTAPEPNQTNGSTTVTTTYTYNAVNQVTSVSYSNGDPGIDYYYGQTSYNGLTISNGKGRRTGMSDGSGETAWSYDSMGRITSEEKTIAGVTKTISYTYNLDGTLATITYPDGNTIAYTTSAADRQTAAVDSANSINYATSATYAPQGALASAVHGNVSGGFAGITESWTYNSDLEPESILATSTAGTALSLTYGYSQPGGNNGSVASITNGNDNGRNETMTYDSLNRILTAQAAASSGQDCWGVSFGSGSLADDALGNLLAMNSTQCTSYYFSHSVNGNNQINSPAGYGYDAPGNMTADGSYDYTYDDEGRITVASITTNGPYCYVYDGDGLRVEKYYANGGSCASPDSKTVVALYWRVYTGQVIEETDGSGDVTTTTGRDYVFFDGRRIAWRDGSGNAYYYFVDTLGSTRVVTDSSGTVCFDADYYPYGQEIDHTTTCTPRYKFAGMEYDSETQSYYDYARYYSPTTGRFMSPDPADLAAVSPANPQSWNRYSYVLNNPASYIDPLGLQCEGVESSLSNGQSSTTYTGCDTWEQFWMGWWMAGLMPSRLILNVGETRRLRLPVALPRSEQSLTQPQPQKPQTTAQGTCTEPTWYQRIGIGALGLVASLTGKTVGVGAGGSAGAGWVMGVAGAAGRQLVVTPSGQAAFLTTVGTNAVPLGPTFGLGAIGGTQFSVSSATSIQQLSGFSGDVSGGYGDIVGFSGDFSFSPGAWQATGTIGLGAGGYGGAGIIESTSVVPICH